MEIQVIINPDGKSCTHYNAWLQAESELKTYMIDIDNSAVIFLYGKKCTINKVTGLYFNFSSIHQAIIENGKAIIR